LENIFLRFKGAHTYFNHAYVQHQMAFFLQLGKCTLLLKSLAIIDALGLQAFFMDIHMTHPLGISWRMTPFPQHL
jgi:hypothetical protein